MKEEQYKVLVVSPKCVHLMFSPLAEGPRCTPIQCSS